MSESMVDDGPKTLTFLDGWTATLPLIAIDQVEFSVQETESHKTTSTAIDFP